QRQQLEDLRHRLDAADTPQPTSKPSADAASVDDKAVKKIVSDYLKEKDAAKKKEEDAKKAKVKEEGYRVGSILGLEGKVDENGYPWFYTPNKDFSLHVGAWMQYDNVFWDQTGLLKVAPGARPGPKQGVASGIAANGIGDLQDGTYFRRIRPFLEGTFWEVG